MIITLVLGLVTLAFVIWPAFSRRNAHISQEAENLRLYTQRKQEIMLSEDSEEDREQMLLELDRELISNDSEGATFKDASPKQKILTAFALFIIMVSSVLFLYEDLGAQDELIATELLNKMNTVNLSKEEQVLLTSSLRHATESNPSNEEWAYLYARTLSSDGQYEESIVTFERILEALPEEAKADRSAALVQIAQAKFNLAGEKADDMIYDYLKSALKLAPNNSQALGMGGIMAYELGYLEEAFDHWKALWLNISTRPEAASLEQGLQQIAAELESQGKTVDMTWMTRAEVKVLVSISDQLKAQLQDTDAVFVMAKALTGPVMPLAAVRIMAKDLPMQVSLNDSQGMVPGLSLSTFEEVQLIARVAKSGEPIAKPGDFEGTFSPVVVKSDETVNLLIDRIIK